MEFTTFKVRKAIALIWILGGLMLFPIFIGQHMFGRFGDEQKEAWAWFLPNITPILLLILGTFASEASKNDMQDKPADKFTSAIALCFSVFYLGVLAATILLNPIVQARNPDRKYLELLQQSGLYLGPLQGLTSAAIGAYFVKSKD